jgi:hypothetical protein
MLFNDFLAEELSGSFTFHVVLTVSIVRDQASKYLSEPYIVDMTKLVQDAIWPNGTLRKNPTARTGKEKAKTKRDAGFKLATIFEGSSRLM